METKDTELEQDTAVVEEKSGEQVLSEMQEDVRSKPTCPKFHSTNPVEGPDILIGESGIASEKPVTIGEMMKQTVSKIPEHIGLRFKTGDTWNNITFQQYYELSVAAAKSFLKVNIATYACIAFF